MRLRHAAMVLPFVLLGCADDSTAPNGLKPQFDHSTDPAVGEITANNYHLHVTGAAMSGDWLGNQMIFNGNMAYGTNANSVFHVNTRNGASDFYGIGLPMEVTTGGVADHQTSALFIERPSNALGVKTKLGLFTVRETYAYTDPDNDDYLIMKYTITNPTNTTVSGLYTGVLLDPDVVNAVNNRAKYDAVLQAAIIEVTTSPIRHAVVLLNSPVGGYKATVNSQDPAISDPATNQQWFNLISTPIVPTVLGPADVRQYIGAPAITLAPGQSHVLEFAFVAGANDVQLGANIAAARAKGAALAAPRAVTKVDVQIRPGTVLYTASVTFPSAAMAANFANGSSVCGDAPIRNSVVTGNRVDLSFDALDIDDELRTGDDFYCTGRLSDGTYFAGADHPTMNVDLTPIRSLTTFAGDDYTPDFSPDGSKIVFGSARLGGGLFIMNTSNGDSTLTQLTFNPLDIQPSWSSDGNTIYFNRSNSTTTPIVLGGIFKVDVATKTVTRLTTNVNLPATNPANRVDSDPEISPDGSTIIFRSFRGGTVPANTVQPYSGNHLWTMSSAGGAATLFAAAVPLGQDVTPKWSTDGSKVYYQSSPTTAQGNIFVKGIAPGSTPVNLTGSEPAGYIFPTVSPDGNTLTTISLGKVLHQDMQSGLHTVPLFDPRIVVLQLNTTRQSMEWSPDGTRLLFVADGNIMITSPKHIVTPVERAAALENSIDALLEDGLISASDASNLQDKLGHVTQLVQAGNVNTALNNLNAFLNKVNAMVNSRRINEITAEQIVVNTDALVAQLTN